MFTGYIPYSYVYLHAHVYSVLYFPYSYTVYVKARTFRKFFDLRIFLAKKGPFSKIFNLVNQEHLHMRLINNNFVTRTLIVLKK